MTAVRTHEVTHSWIVREIATKKVLFETWSEKVANNINTARYEVVPISDYLAELNRDDGGKEAL